MFKAGELDQRVTFRRKVKTPDGMGGSSFSWQDIDTVWAKVRPMTGREREHSDRVNASSNYILVIRSRTDLTEKDTVVWSGTEFNMRFIKQEPRSRFMLIEAERGVPV